MNREEQVSLLTRVLTRFPGKSISLEAFGNVVYAGTLRGKEVFLTGYNEDRKTVQEIAVREGGIALISGMNYQIVGDSIKREVGLSIHRHGQEAVNYFANGGRV